MKRRITWMLAAVFALGAMTAEAAEVALSGFGTLGYAQSNQPYNYERFINSSGTVKRDSIFGAQADIKFTDQIGATVQGKFAPSLKNDSSWDATLNWAFISWRPSNDWLIRLGKQRVPLYLHSEILDVGATYDFVRLPTEMYSLAPTSDYIGGSLEKIWNPDLGEFTLNVYAGNQKINFRFFQRDDIPGFPTQRGMWAVPWNIKAEGIVLTLLRDEDKYRMGFHKITNTADPGQPFITAVPLVPAAAFGATTGAAYVAGGFSDSVDSLVFTLAAEISLPKDFRLTGEYGRRKIDNMMTGMDSNGGYLALLKNIGAWTPYVSYAKIKSRSDVLELYPSVNNNPGLSPVNSATVAGINASQRVLADGLLVYDQDTVALGTSYRLTPKQKIKFEWARTHVGVTSSFVDAPAFGNVSKQDIDVLSFSYNIVF